MLMIRSAGPAAWLGSSLLFLAAIAAPAAAQSKNLLLNPGFEEPLQGHPWMPSGWDTSRAGMIPVFFGRDTFMVHSGTYAGSVANASTFITMAHNWSQVLIVDQAAWGKDLVFSAWTRSNGVEGRAYIKVDAYQDTISKMAKLWGVSRDSAAGRLSINAIDDPLINLGWQREFFTENETDWVRREVRLFVPPSTNVVFARCGIIGTGQLVIDDASLTLEPALPAAKLAANVNLLLDGGFELDGKSWEHSLPPYPGMKIERDSTIKRSGKASVRMSSPSGATVPGPTGVCQVFSNRNFADKRVRLTAFVKTDSLYSNASIKLLCQTPHGVEQIVSSEDLSGTKDWTEARVDMETPSDTYAVWVWLMYTAPAKGRVYFDDATLKVLGPARNP